MNIALSASFPQPPYQALRLSPSKKSLNPKRGSALLPYHGFPHLLGSDPRRASLLSGIGEVGVSRFAFILEEDCAPFAESFAYPVPDDLVLCAVAKDADPAKLSLPNTLESQTNLTFLIAIDGALGDALAKQLAALGLKVERCTPADLAHIAAPPSLDTHTAPCDYPPDETPPPPAAVAVEADTMKRKVFDTSFDVAAFELLEAAEATAAAPVIEDNHTTQLDEHADSSPPAVAAPASGGAAAVDDATRTTPDNEEARGEEGESIRRAPCPARMDTDQDASEPHPTREPLLELSVGIGRPWIEGGVVKRNEKGREIILDLEKIKPWVGTPRELHALLNSYRYASTNKGFKHKVGHFIVGAVFAGVRRKENLQRVTLIILDIDGAPDRTRAQVQALLEALGVGFIFYSTWSNARPESGKTGLCARIILWLANPLEAPADLPQTERCKFMGKRVAALVCFIASRLGLPTINTKVLDRMSKQPVQLMYSPRGHDAGRSSPDCWWCELHDGPALNPNSLPGGVSLADLLPPSKPTNTNNPPSTPAPPHPPSTSSKAAPQTRKGSDDMLRARALAYLATCAKDLNTLGEGSGRYTRISSIAPYLGSIAKGHDLTEAEGLALFDQALNGWGRKDLTRAFNSMFTYGYRNESRTLPINDPPRSSSKSSKKTASPNADANTSSAAPSTANDAQPDTTPPHAGAASIAPRRSPPFAKGNPELGTCLALRRLFDSLLSQDPPDQRPHLVCIDSAEDIDAIAAKIPDGKTVWIAIPTKHRLYPHAFNTFRSKGCEICLRDSSHV